MPASKVNIKFVTLLVLGLIVLLGAGMYLANRTISKPASEHFRAGNEFAEKGDWEKASVSYSKAVSKEKKLEYLKAWVNSLEHLTPATQQQYQDMFRGVYMLARRGLAAAQPTDPEAQKPALDMALMIYKTGADSGTWEGYVQQCEDVLREFPPGDKAAEPLRRYRGIARTNWIAQVATAPDDALTKARDDLEAALKAEPTDPVTMAAIGDWYRVAAQRARERRENERADGLEKEAMERLDKFAANNDKSNLPVIWTLIQMRMLEESRTKEYQSVPYRETLVRHHPKVKRLLDQVLAENPDKLDRYLVFQIGAMTLAAGYPNAGDEIEKIFAHALSRRPDDVFLISQLGQLQLDTGNYDKAYDTLDKLVKMPDKPMSIEGFFLFGMREEATIKQAGCALGQAVKVRSAAERKFSETKDDAARAELIKNADNEFRQGLDRAKALRAKFAEVYGKAPSLTLLDARIKYFEDDLVEARKLLTAYTEQKPNDLGALKLLANILLRQQQGGAARIQLERVTRLNPTDLEALVSLAMTLESLGEYKEAITTYEKAMVLDPGNAQIAERIGKVKDVAAKGDSNDPVVKVLSEAQDKVTGSGGAAPDMAGALAMVKKLYKDQSALKKLDRPKLIAIAQAFVLLEDREMARTVITDKLLDPKDPAVKAILLLIDNPDPIAARLASIEASSLPETFKTLLKYQLYRKADKLELAKEMLAKVKAADPEHPLVISAMFDEALFNKKFDEARALAEKAAAKNVDRVNGAVFRIRLEQMEGRLPAAAAMAQQLVDTDPLSAMGHRLLGMVRLEMSQPTEALASFERALQINPTDPENIKGKLRAMIGLKKYGDALLFARDRRSFASGDAEFVQINLALEAETGNVEFAIDRYQREYNRNPDNRDNALELANLLNKNKQFERARPIIDGLLKQKVDDQSMVLSANWYAQQGNMNKAAEEWEGYIKTLPPERVTAVTYVQYGEFLISFGDFPRARKMLEEHRSLQHPEIAEIDRQLGDVCVRYGDWATAIENYKRALSTVTKDDGNILRYRIIECTLRLGDSDNTKFAEAVKLCDEASAKGIVDDLQLVLLRADATRGAGDFPAARKLYDKAVAISPNSALGFYKRAEFITADMIRAQKAQNGQLPAEDVKRYLKDAQDDLEAALRFDSAFGPARSLLAKVRLNQGEPEVAAKLLADGIAIDPNNGIMRGDLVQIYAAQGKIEEALALIEEGTKRSKSTDWLIMAGDLLRARAEMGRAAEKYGAAWDRGTRTPQLARVYTEALLAQPKPDLEKVLGVLNDPKADTDKWTALLSQRAKVLRMQGKSPESDQNVKAAFAALDERNSSAVSILFQDLGEMFAGRIRDMLALIDASKPAGGFSPGIGVQVIRFKLVDESVAAEGIKDLDGLMANKDINPEALYRVFRNLADLLYSQKAYKSAAAVYQRILTLKADDFDTMNNYAYTLSHHLGQHEEALKHAQAAADHFPKNPNVLDTLGTVQLALGRVGEAETTLLRALDEAKTAVQQVPIYIHLAQVMLAKGDRVKAKNRLDEAEREIARDARLQVQFKAEFDEVSKKVNPGR